MVRYQSTEAMATSDDITDLCEVDQLCSGLKGGIEGAVHTMRELFEEHQAHGWSLLLVDARNAFNSLSRDCYADQRR